MERPARSPVGFRGDAMLRGGAVRSTVVILAVAVYMPAAAHEPADKSQEQESGHEEFERNMAGVFLGVTAGGEEEGGGREDSTGTIGVEYRRRLSRLIGVGFLYEFAGGERRDHVGIVPLTFWLAPKAELVVGVGWERSSGTEIFAGELEPLARLGFGYGIELLPGNSIRPVINVDFVDGEELVVVGASIGWEF